MVTAVKFRKISFLLIALLLIASALAVETAKTAIRVDDTHEISYYMLDGIEVVPSEHGVETHKADYVLAVQTCMRTTKTWFLEPDHRTLHSLCEGDDGTVYDIVLILKKGARKLYEKTAFSRHGNLNAVKSRFEKNGFVRIKFETILNKLR